MNRHFFGCLLLGTLSLTQAGCESRTVVKPDGDGTTVIEERETVIEKPDTDTDTDGGVDVQVGGGEGVKVNVDKDANP